jgi:hypothetical protein
LQANKGVLAECCQLFNEASVSYVVAGGWVPYLRGGNSSLTHPGTNDVDLLLNDDCETVEKALKVLLTKGYAPSAKHQFQLLKRLPVGGEHFVFNVDLMHPAEAEGRSEMFQDIMDLGVREDYDPLSTRHIKSIVFPSSRIVFDEELWSMHDLEAFLPDGSRVNVPIPLMDERALILSKCKSVRSDKRDRDAFDIFFILTGPEGTSVAADLLALGKRFPQVQAQLDCLTDHLRTAAATFSSRVARFSDPNQLNDPAGQVLSILTQ